MPRSTDQGERIPAVLDRSGFPSQLDSVRSLPILVRSPYCPMEPITPLTSSTTLGAFGSGPLATSGLLRGSTPIVDTNEHVLRVSAEDVRLTLATISYLWDREVTLRSQEDTIHALQQNTERLLRAEIACKKRSTLCTDRPPHFFSFVQRRYDLMQCRYVDTVHSLRDCRLALRTRREQSAKSYG